MFHSLALEYHPVLFRLTKSCLDFNLGLIIHSYLPHKLWMIRYCVPGSMLGVRCGAEQSSQFPCSSGTYSLAETDTIQITSLGLPCPCFSLCLSVTHNVNSEHTVTEKRDLDRESTKMKTIWKMATVRIPLLWRIKKDSWQAVWAWTGIEAGEPMGHEYVEEQRKAI